MLGVLSVSMRRTGLGWGTETDFVGVFAPEAARIIAGEPLKLPFHPPGYAFALAAVQALVDDWLLAGLLISAGAAAIAVFASAWTIGRLFGVAASFGTLAACGCSLLFMSFASQATSDMAFAALLASTLACLVTGMTDAARPRIWFVTGLLAGLAVLTRTNGIAVIAVVAAPLLLPTRLTQRFVLSGIAAIGLAVPLLAWGLYAHLSGSPFSPTNAHVTMAIAAYADGRGTGERLHVAAAEFHSMRDVLMHDPLGMVRSLTMRLLSLPKLLATKLTWPPIAIAGFGGLLLALYRDRSRAVLAYLAILAMLTGLTAIAPFQARLHLCLVPVMGGFAAYAASTLLERATTRQLTKSLVWAGLGLAMLLIALSAHRQVLPRLETSFQQELAQAAISIHDHVGSDAVIYSRKNHLGLATGREVRWLPDSTSLEALREALCADLQPGRVSYFYFGRAERQYRPELAAEFSSRPTPEWLERVAGGDTPPWTLYRILLRADGKPTASTCEPPRDTD
jgi:4-amino-4-deoxy-L-arabinose transferase-like glycosyltransferase